MQDISVQRNGIQEEESPYHAGFGIFIPADKKTYHNSVEIVPIIHHKDGLVMPVNDLPVLSHHRLQNNDVKVLLKDQEILRKWQRDTDKSEDISAMRKDDNNIQEFNINRLRTGIGSINGYHNLDMLKLTHAPFENYKNQPNLVNLNQNIAPDAINSDRSHSIIPRYFNNGPSSYYKQHNSNSKDDQLAYKLKYEQGLSEDIQKKIFKNQRIQKSRQLKNQVNPRKKLKRSNDWTPYFNKNIPKNWGIPQNKQFGRITIKDKYKIQLIPNMPPRLVKETGNGLNPPKILPHYLPVNHLRAQQDYFNMKQAEIYSDMFLKKSNNLRNIQNNRDNNIQNLDDNQVFVKIPLQNYSEFMYPLKIYPKGINLNTVVTQVPILDKPINQPDYNNDLVEIVKKALNKNNFSNSYSKVSFKLKNENQVTKNNPTLSKLDDQYMTLNKLNDAKINPSFAVPSKPTEQNDSNFNGSKIKSSVATSSHYEYPTPKVISTGTNKNSIASISRYNFNNWYNSKTLENEVNFLVKERNGSNSNPNIPKSLNDKPKIGDIALRNIENSPQPTLVSAKEPTVKVPETQINTTDNKTIIPDSGLANGFESKKTKEEGQMKNTKLTIHPDGNSVRIHNKKKQNQQMGFGQRRNTKSTKSLIYPVSNSVRRKPNEFFKKKQNQEKVFGQMNKNGDLDFLCDCERSCNDTILGTIWRRLNWPFHRQVSLATLYRCPVKKFINNNFWYIKEAVLNVFRAKTNEATNVARRTKVFNEPYTYPPLPGPRGPPITLDPRIPRPRIKSIGPPGPMEPPRPARFGETSRPQRGWARASNGRIPFGAFSAGQTKEGVMVYIGRAPFYDFKKREYGLIPGMVIDDEKCVRFNWRGEEICQPNYEILVGDEFSWVESSHKHFHPDRLIGGYEFSVNTLLGICKEMVNGLLVVSKLSLDEGKCFVAKQNKTDKETSFNKYEMLVQ